MKSGIEYISDRIIHVTYTPKDNDSSLPHDVFAGANTHVSNDSLGYVAQHSDRPQKDCSPIAFSWNDTTVLTQVQAILSPKTMYRVETDPTSLEKKMTANGEVTYSESKRRVPWKETRSAALTFEIGSDELLLGLGQYEDGLWDLRGRREYLYESNMRISIPLLVTTGHYGILIDSESSMVFTSTVETITFEIDSVSTLSYYVLLGDTIEDLLSGYYQLTGLPSMLPRWAFGYIQSKERYQTSTELESIASGFRERDIPLDCLVQDWYSWEDGLWGQKTFDHKRYPYLSAAISRLHENHVHFMVSIWPNMSPDSANYHEFQEHDLLLPGSNLYDAFDDKARSLYWKQCEEEIMSSGADALWCDNAEPFSDADWNGETKRPEEERYQIVTDLSKESMDWEHLNSYGLYHAKGIYENWRQSYPDKRVVNLTRSGYTGIQKYGTILWSGDITATYDTLRKQITEGLKMALTGMPYWTLDIGGFFVVNDRYENRGCNDTAHLPLWFWKGDYNDGVADPAYRELYVRWLEFGTFLPIFRSHGTDTPREPWQFGSPGDPFYDAIVQNIRLRYRLLPYLYSLAAAAHREGTVMMRSLLLDYGNDPAVREITDEYLLGPSLLIAPVYEPMYDLPGGAPLCNAVPSSSNASAERHAAAAPETDHVIPTRRVYLPKGNGWYDFHTGTHYEGGTWLDAAAPLDRIPVFVPEGSILPLSQDLHYADEQNGQADLLQIYTGRDGHFTLYNDAGDGYDFEEGDYYTDACIFTEKGCSLTHSVTGNYPAVPAPKVTYITP